MVFIHFILLLFSFLVCSLQAYDSADVRFEVEKGLGKRLTLKAFERSSLLFSQTVDPTFNAALIFGQNVLSRQGNGYKILYKGRDETSLSLEDAIKHVAISYGTRSNTGKGLQEWSQVSNANHAGHLHLQMIYRKIDDLNFKVNNLESEVKLLKAAQEKTDAKYNNLFQLLQDETKARTQSVESFNQTVKDQMDRV